MNPVEVIKGDGPIVLGQPHGGTYVPSEIHAHLNERGKGLDDTDWHIAKLYEGVSAGLTVVKATFHRYVIDANRDPAGQSLYPGQNTTTLCPITDFDGEPIWLEGREPDAEEVERRRQLFHAPYHNALRSEIERVKAKHGFAILYDCHSIRSDIPFLFEGILPIFNTGTNNGETCSADIENVVTSICRRSEQFDSVVNGRFKGGWTTRHYGQPQDRVHAIQMEISQRAYMEEVAPWAYREDRAAQIRPILSEIFNSLNALAASMSIEHKGNKS